MSSEPRSYHLWYSWYHTHTRLTALCPGLPRWAGTRKVKPIWILLKQQTASGSGISWAICKSAPRSGQITMPAPHRSVFTGRMPFLLPNQQCQSTDGKFLISVDVNNYSFKLYLICALNNWDDCQKSLQKPLVKIINNCCSIITPKQTVLYYVQLFTWKTDLNVFSQIFVVISQLLKAQICSRVNCCIERIGNPSRSINIMYILYK